MLYSYTENSCHHRVLASSVKQHR